METVLEIYVSLEKMGVLFNFTVVLSYEQRDPVLISGIRAEDMLLACIERFQATSYYDVATMIFSGKLFQFMQQGK